METINPNNYPATRATGVVVNHINSKLGSPHRIFQVKEVTKASKEIIEGVGDKYHLTFSMKDYLNERPPINCTASVLYYLSEKRQAPDVTFQLQPQPENYTQDKDIEFYNNMYRMSPPLEAQDIPDKFGNVKPELEPVLHLALVACDDVKWQHSTENTFFSMAVIKSVKQLKTEKKALQFHLNMLIHDIVSQEMIPWKIDILWDPCQGLKVEYEERLPKCSHCEADP
uniref:Retinoic acid receptor responder 1 n=1 Tax=Leptobrachium leishanense TaxID=445787 RepID=A0A8C5PL49_9ANUR